MPATPKYKLPYPTLADPNNVPADLLRMANGVEAALASVGDLVTIGPSLESSQWDRVSGYGASCYRIGRLVTLSIGLIQRATAPDNRPALRIPVEHCPGSSVGIVCATSARTSGLFVVDTVGGIAPAIAYGPATPAGTVWIGQACWIAAK